LNLLVESAPIRGDNSLVVNEEPTKQFTDRRSFEERVFARFDAIDKRFEAIDKRFDVIDKRFEGVYARFDVLEVRLEKLESRSYDTKPIWERALAAITQTNLEVGEIKTRVAAIETKVGAIETKIGTLEGEVAGVRADYGNLHNELIESQRDFKVKLMRRVDVVLEVMVDTRNGLREADERLTRLESKLA
jgi:chromosome segregation ATPase